MFTMWAPYMYDSVSELSEDIEVELTALGSGQYAITLTPDAVWLNSPDRVYPIVIDPDVSVSRARTNIIDNTVMEGQGNQNRNLDRLYIGQKSGARVRAFLKYDVMPTIPSGATITAATQTLYITSGTDTGSTAGAYIVTDGDWSSDTITWANRPAARTTIQSAISHNNFSYYQFSCLSAVQKWYTGSTIGKNANYGITVRYTDETINDYNAFYSADYSIESSRPLLTITYRFNEEGTGGGSSFGSAVALELGYPASLSTASVNEFRYFKFTPTITASYVIQSSDSSGDPIVWLYDNNYEVIGKDDDTGDGWNFRYTKSLTAGRTYYIAAGHAASKTGQYDITVLKPAIQANVENGFYYIWNRGAALYLDIHGPSEQKYIHQWTMHSQESEKWLVQLQSDGYWTLRSQYGDNLYVGVSNANSGENNVQLFSGISDQTRWNLYVDYEGTYIFEPKFALGKVMYAPNSYVDTEMTLGWIGYGGSCARWGFSAFSYSGPTFSALDVGDSPNDEAELFARYFSNYGYTNIGSYNNADEFIPAQTVKDLGRYSDIVYVNGHGGRPPCLWVERYESGEDKVVEYLSPKKEIYSNTEHLDLEYQVGIGADWINTNKTITNSDWDAGTKWAILGQCHQLAYDSPYIEAQWDGQWNALWWARVMLGENERMHGILGYYLAAPPEDVSYDRLENFLQNVENTTILNAWKKAHTKILDANTNWAMLYNSENANDRIDNFTASSTPGSTYTMYLVRREGDLMFEHADPTTRISTANMNGISDNTFPHFENDIDIEAINNTYSKLQAALCIDENDSLTIDESHKITYTNLECRLSEDNLGFVLAEDEAIDTALQMLTDLDLAPEGNYRAKVSVVNRYSLVFEESELPAPETIEYMVSFYRTYNGLDVISDEEDGIVVAFDKYGLTALNYKWRDINLVSNNEFTLTKAITEDQAKEIYLNAMNLNDQYTRTSSGSKFTAPVTRMAYLQIDQEMRLVWVCAPGNGYGNHIFIDAKTGGQLNI